MEDSNFIESLSLFMCMHCTKTYVYCLICVLILNFQCKASPSQASRITPEKSLHVFSTYKDNYQVVMKADH